MSNKEVVIEVLKKYGCSSSRQIAILALRDYDVHMTPAQVSGALRPMIAKGLAANSKDDKNTTIYWLNKREW